MASGNQAIEGIVCSPVIIEPTAERAIFDEATIAADDDADGERRGRSRRPPGASSRRRPRTTVPSAISSPSRSNTVAGAGSTYSGRHPDHTTICQSSRAEGDGGHLRPRRQPDAPAELGRGRAGASPSVTVALSSRRDVGGLGRRRSSGSTASMGERLLSELVGHGGGERADLGRVDAPGPLDRDVEAGRDPSRPGRHDDDAVAEPGRLADVVGDEQTVSPRARTSVSSSSCRASRVIASSAPNGSSISRMSASWANARASAPRWRMPPDSWWGRFLAKPSRCTAVEQLLDPRPALGLRHAGEPHRQLDVGRHGEPREQRRLLEHQRRPAPRRRPSRSSASSSPATRLRIVDLPHPEAPIRQTNSPSADVEVDVARAR